MLKGCKNHVAHSAQQFAGSGISTEVGPHNQRIDEEPDERLGFWAAATRNWSADNDVFLIRVAHQQRLECRQQRHKERHVFLLAELLQRIEQMPRQINRQMSTTECLSGRPWTVRW